MQRHTLFPPPKAASAIGSPPQTSIIALPRIPILVDFQDIGDNGKLLPDSTIAAILADLNSFETKRKADHPNWSKSRYTKRELSPHNQYSIVKCGNILFALYKGAKWNKLIGKGSYGRGKIAQNLMTGEWCVYKIQGTRGLNSFAKEKHSHKKFNIDREYEHIAALQQACATPEDRISYKKQEYQYNFLMTLIHGKNMRIFAESTNPRYQIVPVTFWLRMIIEMLKPVYELHTTHLRLHRDIKPENIIYDPATHSAKTIDYGFTVQITPDRPTYTGEAKGSIIYTDYPIREASKKQSKSTVIQYSLTTEIFSLAASIADTLSLLYFPDDLYDFNPKEHYIHGKGEALFDNNTRIADEALRTNIVNHLKKMVAVDTATRPSIPETTAFFTTIYQEQLKNHPAIHVTTIHVDDWIALDQQNQQIILENLAKDPLLWKICLIDSKTRDQRTYNNIRRQFEMKELLATDYVLVNPVKKLLMQTSIDIIMQREHDPLQSIRCTHHSITPVDTALEATSVKPTLSSP